MPSRSGVGETRRRNHKQVTNDHGLLNQVAHSLARYLRRGNALPAPEQTRAAAHRYTEEELSARAEEFNRKADTYWLKLADDPSGRRHTLNKPFSGVIAAPGTLYRLGLALEELHVGVGLTVLDFGAGSCWFSSCLNRLGCRTIALDVSPAALELGRELFRLDPRHRPELEPRFEVYNGHRIPLPDASVDRIGCFDAFHHVPNQDEVLGEMFRVLREGGRVVLAEPGEGHTHSDHATFDTERYGILENELDILDLERRARAAGFREVSLKPYPDPGVMSVSPRDYTRLMEGDPQPFPMASLQQSLRSNFIVVLQKGHAERDSRCPGRLRARLELIDPRGPLLARGGTTLTLLVAVWNEGDTVWRHGIDPLGGSVMLGSHLLDERRSLIRADFSRTELSIDVPPGAVIQVLAHVPAPSDPGRYVLRFDPVDDQVAWFSQIGSPTLDLEVEIRSDVDAPSLRADIAALQAGLLRLPAGVRRELLLQVTNTGSCRWPDSPTPGPYAIRLAGQLLSAEGELLDRDFLRESLPGEVAVGGSVTVPVRFRAPLEPGRYVLKIDLVQECVCWFEERGSRALRLTLEVTDEVPDSTDPGVLRASLELLVSEPTLRGRPHSRVPLLLRATNRGNTLWLHERRPSGGHVALGGHLIPEDTNTAVDYVRLPLPADVPPRATVEIAGELEMPATPGIHRLELDLVAEGIAWFGTSGAPLVQVVVEEP
jgi:SAM-dependent methyltransferase